MGTYDTSKHPDVIKGTKTPQEVLSEFLETFEVGSTDKDGKVTFEEFEHYYSNVSSSIDDDDYFELMMRNAWHISGGEGWCANTANRRVLVTHADGKQTVEEVKNDLGIAADDSAAIDANLRAQVSGEGRTRADKIPASQRIHHPFTHFLRASTTRSVSQPRSPVTTQSRRGGCGRPTPSIQRFRSRRAPERSGLVRVGRQGGVRKPRIREGRVGTERTPRLGSSRAGS